MAEVTTRHASFYEGLAWIDVVEDDAEPLDRNLVRIEWANNTGFDFAVTVLRDDLTEWFAVTVPDGGSGTQDARHTGPPSQRIRTVDDLPRWRMDVG